METHVKSEIVRIGKLLYEKKLVNAYEGNISVKEGGKVYCTPSGVCVGFIDEGMIVAVNESGATIEGSLAPTSELKLHLECYRQRPDINAVVHTHSPYATAYALANIPITSKAYPEMILVFGQIPVVSYGAPSTVEVCEGLGAHIKKSDVFLLSRHGVLAIGSNLCEAFCKVEAAESMAKTLTITRMLGGEAPLSESQLGQLCRMRKKQ